MTGRARVSFVPAHGIECADVTARRVHQYTVVALALFGLAAGGPLGTALLALDGLVMLFGRFWGPADVFRQVVWRVAEPRGWLTPVMVPEELGTRRVARAIGGLLLLVMASTVAYGQRLVGVVIGVPLLTMILLDATLSFCALCFLNFQARRLRFILAG